MSSDVCQIAIEHPRVIICDNSRGDVRDVMGFVSCRLRCAGQQIVAVIDCYDDERLQKCGT